MYNIFRKSLKIVEVGLLALLLFSCATTKITTTEFNNKNISMEDFFSESKEVIFFVDNIDNSFLLSSLLKGSNISKNELDILGKSREIYGALGEKKDDVDLVLIGEYSKSIMEFGLFLSFHWKKIKSQGVTYWHNKSGINIFIRDNGTIVISGANIVNLIKDIAGRDIERPEYSIVVSVPTLSEETLKEITKGFIKTGIDSLKVVSNKDRDIYNSTCMLMFPSNGKAKAFSRIIGLVITLTTGGINDPEIRKMSKDIRIKVDEKVLLIENIVLNEKKIAEIANKLIIMTGDADK